MTKEDYIRNKKYGLIYLHYEDEFSLKDISKIFIDEDTGKSVVISAIGSSIWYENYSKKSNFIEIKKSIMGESGKLYGKVSPMNMFFWLTAATKNQVKSLLRENSESIEWIRNAYKVFKNHKCKSVVALLDLTNVKNHELGDVTYLNCAKLKIGGVELISEYLLSNFIIEWMEEFRYSQLEPVSDTYYKSIHGNDYETEFFFSKGSKSYERGFSSPLFTFDKKFNLSHLTVGEVVTHEDDYSTWETEEGSYCYFNLNLDKVKIIDDSLTIPRRILEILDEGQINHLNKTAASVINDDLIRVYSGIFNQIIPSDISETRSNNSIDTWGSDMYDILGGDGTDTVYLGDGVSIDSRGNLVDD